MIKLFGLPSLRVEVILRRIAPGWDLESPKVPAQSASASYMTWDEFDISSRIPRCGVRVQHNKLRAKFLDHKLTEAN